MNLRAVVTLPASIERFLRHLGEPVEPLPLSPPRGRPFFKSRAVRRKLGELGYTPPPAEDEGGCAVRGTTRPAGLPLAAALLIAAMMLWRRARVQR